MTNKFHPEQHFAAMEKTMGLTVEDAWKPLVLEHLAIAAEMAELTKRVAIPNAQLDLANVFVAGDSKNRNSDA